jgi:hypothetical protein
MKLPFATTLVSCSLFTLHLLYPFSVDGFTGSYVHVKTTDHFYLQPQQLTSGCSGEFNSLRRTILTRRLAAVGDDEEEEEDEEEDLEQKGPLSNGINSVSWLPSVSGAKGDNMPISSVRDVRHILCLVDSYEDFIEKLELAILCQFRKPVFSNNPFFHPISGFGNITSLPTRWFRVHSQHRTCLEYL